MYVNIRSEWREQLKSLVEAQELLSPFVKKQEHCQYLVFYLRRIQDIEDCMKKKTLQKPDYRI